MKNYYIVDFMATDPSKDMRQQFVEILTAAFDNCLVDIFCYPESAVDPEGAAEFPESKLWIWLVVVNVRFARANFIKVQKARELIQGLPIDFGDLERIPKYRVESLRQNLSDYWVVKREDGAWY